jgi:hypothetical protein
MTIYHINDGPDYHPNKKRWVEILKASETPGMIVCRDINTDEIIVTERGKLERSEMKEA